MRVCTWCASLTDKSICPHCAAQGHLYRTVDDGQYGFAWLRDRWQRQNWQTGLARLANAEESWRMHRES